MFCVGRGSTWFFVHDDYSFEPYGGLFDTRVEAERVAQLLRLVSGSIDSTYDAREAIGNMIAGLRWDIRECSEHMETRARASALRWVADLAQTRLESVTRPK